MGKRSLYLPDELEARVDAARLVDRRSLSNYVQWALELVLGDVAGGSGSAQRGRSPEGPGSDVPPAASTRARRAVPAVPGVESARDLLMRQRQERLNGGRGL